MKQCSSHLAPQMLINKHTKWHPLCFLPWQQFCFWSCQLKLPVFVLTIRTLSSSQSNDESYEKMETMSVPSRTLCRTLKGWKWGYLIFERRKTGAKRVPMATTIWLSFRFVCDVHFCCQVWRTLLQHFQRYFLFSILPFNKSGVYMNRSEIWSNIKGNC